MQDGYELWISQDEARYQRRLKRIDRQFNSHACSFALPNEAYLAPFIGLPLPWLFLCLNFTLATPYTSKDDPQGGENANAQNVTTKKIAREWAYGVPMVRPSTWKGDLLFAARQAETNATILKQLFGPEKGHQGPATEIETGDRNQGLLRFFPTFFVGRVEEEVEEEVINPHSRVTRKGRVPVTFEGVPKGANGSFSLLYAARDADAIKSNVCAIGTWIAAMLTRHGFGARRLKGMGLASATCPTAWLWTPGNGRTGLPNNLNLNNLSATLARHV